MKLILYGYNETAGFDVLWLSVRVSEQSGLRVKNFPLAIVDVADVAGIEYFFITTQTATVFAPAPVPVQ